MIFVDTSYLVALFDASEQHHKRAMTWSDVLRQRLLVSEYVLLEVINSFSEPFDRPKAHAVVDFARADANFQIIPCGTDLFEAGLTLHRQRPDKQWSLTDCVSFELMRHYAIRQALTHDHHFVQAGFDALLRRDPT